MLDSIRSVTGDLLSVTEICTNFSLLYKKVALFLKGVYVN